MAGRVHPETSDSKAERAHATGGCCYNFKEEFRLHKFGLGYKNPSLFVKPQCFRPCCYIAWTVLWVLFYTANLVLEVYYNRGRSDPGYGGRYFIYATNITYLHQSALVFTDCIVTIYVFIRRKDIREGLARGTTWYIKMQWLLFNISNTLSLVVTSLYYIQPDRSFSHESINTHLLNSVYTILGLLISAKPVQLLHVYQPMAPALMYLVFSIIYHFCAFDPIYPIIDWDITERATWVVILVLMVAVPVMHIVCYIIYSLRVLVSRKYNCTKV